MQSTIDPNFVLLGLSALILLAFILEQLGRRMKLPSVMLLLGTGMAARWMFETPDGVLPFAVALLPSVGTIGLILIVLEGALDLELRRDRLKLIRRSFVSSLLGIVFSAVAIAWVLQYFFDMDGLTALVNALPLSVISSAVAIPSAKHLVRDQREFVTYESSFSDILGVMVFGLVATAGSVHLSGVASYVGQFVLTIIAAAALSLLLVWYLDKVEHHVRFLPVFAFLLGAYGLAKAYHLSPLVLILTFGLALSNPHVFIRGNFARFFRTHRMEEDLVHFRSISVELVFLVKAVFFLLFGYTIDVLHLFTRANLITSGLIVAAILGVRILTVFLSTRRLGLAVFIAPRGLITILLFIGIPLSYQSSLVSQEVVTLVVFGTILFMLPASLTSSRQ